MEENRKQEFYELLVQNVQKGEVYAVKLKGDPQIYSAIPMIPGRLQNNDPGKFVLKVLAPAERKGVYEYTMDELESIEEKE
ncbi:MAG: hypothetical protein ACOC1D_01280 [Prolixibacteraceae bacterium]